MFYAKFIPYLELKLAPLRSLCTDCWDDPITESNWTQERKEAWENCKQSVLADPCIQQYDAGKRVYLCTDFAKRGMGVAACQPANDEISLAAMKREMLGGPCEFFTDLKKLGSPPCLHPISFASRKNKGYELNLHSHLGEGFALDWAINTNKLYCWGQRFTAVNDCYSLKFVLSYEGTNPVILRLQMRLMMWAMDIVHRVRTFNVPPDYFSKLASDTIFDPLLAEYYRVAIDERLRFPAPSGEMTPEMMPGWRKPKGVPTSAENALPGVTVDRQPVCYSSVLTEAEHIHYLHSTIFQHDSLGHDTLSVYPVTFCPRSSIVHPIFVTTRAQARRERENQAAAADSTPEEPPTLTTDDQDLSNADIPSAARQLTRFQAVLYGFGSGHVCNSISAQSLPIVVVAASDRDIQARSLLQNLYNVPRYFSHVPTDNDPGFQSCWWDYQVTIISSLRMHRGLQLLQIFVPTTFAGNSLANRFCKKLRASGWCISHQDISFPSFGDSIDDGRFIIFGQHTSTAASIRPLVLLAPPPTPVKPIEAYIHEPFDHMTYALSLAKDYLPHDDPLYVLEGSHANATATSQHDLIASMTCSEEQILRA
jgi:hypothetical protein